MSASIHFFIRTERPSKDGSVPIYILFGLNRTKRIKIATGKYAPLKKEFKKLTAHQIQSKTKMEKESMYCWNKTRERVAGAGKIGDLINVFLDHEKKRINDIVVKYELMGKPLTLEAFKAKYFKPNGNDRFLEYFEYELKEKKSCSVSKETLKTYLTVVTKINNFKPNLTLSDIDYRFLKDLENYMLKPIKEGGLGNEQVTASKTLAILRTLILIAIKNGDMDKENYPFKDFKIKQVDVVLTSRDYLEPGEILKIEELLSPENIHELLPGQIRATKRFLFSCYTGLRFTDVNNLDRKTHIFSKYILNPQTNQMVLRYFVEIKMHKVARPVYIPLIEKALELIDLSSEGSIFPKITNQKINEHLKDIAKKAKIEKNLTFHVARHSFATTCFLYGIPDIVGQRLLGHKNRKFTEVYTHLSQNKLFYEMDKLNAGLTQYQIMPDDLENNKEGVNDLFPSLQNLPPEKLNKLKEVVRLFL